MVYVGVLIGHLSVFPLVNPGLMSLEGLKTNETIDTHKVKNHSSYFI